MSKQVEFLNLGLIDYQKAWDFQEKIFEQTVQRKIDQRKGLTEVPTTNILIFCQHPHVYTLGKSGKEENLLLDSERLKEVEATYYKINRGGDITYHGPGQLVAYPIFDLDHFFTDIHKYLRFLEEAVIQTIAEYGIVGERIDGLTGVWVGADTDHPRKICALGVKCSRWVTMHGIGFNINTDLSYFKHIVPCGIDDKEVTSMKQELGREIPFLEVEQLLLTKMAALFDFQWIANEPHQADFS